MRLTMKPGVERACTATLPHTLESRKMASATAGAVCRPDTTSTSFISGTGLKKCMPTSRCGWCRPLAMAVTEMDEVLVASTQSADTMPSSCLNRLRLASSFSTMASTTRWAWAALSSAEMAVMRSSAWAATSAVSLPLAARVCRVAANWVRDWSAAPSRTSNSMTGCPASAATWAMPAPMMPAPTTSTGAWFRSNRDDRVWLMGCSVGSVGPG